MFGIRKFSNNKIGKKIIENLYEFNEFNNLDCKIYLLKNQISEDDYELILIDSGNALNSSNLIGGIKDLGFNPKKITKIVITHEHLDHILGIYNIPELLNKEIEIFALGDTMKAIQNAEEDIIAPRSLGIGINVFRVELKKKKVNELKEGDHLKIGNFDFEVFYTPGHSLGSMTLYEKNNKILFPGDVVFCGGSFGRFDFPGGSIQMLKNSIKRLTTIDVKYLCPGHMHSSSHGNEEIKHSNSIINSLY